YFTLNASDGEGTLEFNLDNLHFEEKPEINTYVITFKDYDGSVISSQEYEEGATVLVPSNPTRSAVANECEYEFAGWDYAVTVAEADATYTATYNVINVVDMFNCKIENGGIDGFTYDTSAVNGESNRSLKISEPITKDNLPYFTISLDKTYDLTNKYIVFDINFTKDGWLVGFDFVNDGVKLGLWNMHTIKVGEKSTSHRCEDLENGWVRVYVDASALSASTNNVSKIYFTLNASDGEGTLEFNLDNLHFEEKPEINTYVITFKNYDGEVISSEEYEEGATVSIPENPTRAEDGECTYAFAGWDYEVTAVNCDATYTATYTVTSVIDLWNCEIENSGIDGLTYDTSAVNGESNRSLKVSEPITSGNLPYFAISLDKTYDLTNKYIVFDINFTKDGWLFAFDFVNDGAKNGLWKVHTIKKDEASDSHKCEDLGNGWLRVFVNAGALSSSINKVSKIYFTLNASDGSGTLEFNLDNLHFEDIPAVEEPETPNPEDPTVEVDRIEDCGLVAVNGGSFTKENGYAVATVPANNSGVWWNYDVDLTALLGKGLNFSGKTITFDVKIVGNMTWVGFTVADGYGSYVKPNNEDYAWMNLSDGWSGFDMTVTAVEDGWFRVSLAPSTTFASVKENVGKLRFLVNPQDANEASFLIDNLYLGELVGYVEPAKTDIINECGFVAVNGGTFVYDSANGYAKATVPANNSGVWWNFDIGLIDISGEEVNLSGKTISFDVKIVGNMSWVGFTVGYVNGQYAQVNGEGYAWTNLTDKWSGYGISITAIEDGWFRVSVTIDESFGSVSSKITKLRFLVNPKDASEATFSVDNLYL
ncbi:MAG: InlB B-repeat-containing protein, partial [Clostridia bacterium]|nr:InlB B-repeat-containing protein [Clostridia bacterium]